MKSIQETMQRLKNTLEAKKQMPNVIAEAHGQLPYVKRPAQGIVTKKQHETDTTKFKLVVYYSHKKDGTPYTIIEKQNKLHRKYHDSIDFQPQYCPILKETEYVTRHDIAFEKLLHHLTYYSSRIHNAILFMNDFANNKQLHIMHWDQDLSKVKYVNPVFTQKGNHVFATDLQGKALDIDILKP